MVQQKMVLTDFGTEMQSSMEYMINRLGNVLSDVKNPTMTMADANLAALTTLTIIGVIAARLAFLEQRFDLNNAELRTKVMHDKQEEINSFVTNIIKYAHSTLPEFGVQVENLTMVDEDF